MEEWRTIPGWEDYEASDFGRVRRTLASNAGPAGRLLKQSSNKDGYMVVNITKDKRAYRKFVHVLVMLAFVGPKSSTQEVLHGDDVGAHNRLSNLSYGSRQRNMEDCAKKGRIASTKATKELVTKIRRLHSEGQSQRSLSKQFSLGYATVGNIIHWRTWKHLQQEI